MSLNGVPEAAVLAEENFYFDAGKLQEAETQYQEHLAAMRKGCVGGDMPNGLPKIAVPNYFSALSLEIANIRSKIKNFNLEGGDRPSSECKHTICASMILAEEGNPTITEVINQIRNDYASLKEKMETVVVKQDKQIKDILKRLDKIEDKLEGKRESSASKQRKFERQLKEVTRDATAFAEHIMNGVPLPEELCFVYKHKRLSRQIEEVKKQAEDYKNMIKERNVKNRAAKDDDDDIDLFGSDEETEEERKVKEERLKAYADKKAKKAPVIAKSSVVLDVKPWSDETDLKDMETQVRKIESDGLKWGASKLVPLAYGIRKLQIIAIVEDDNCSIDWLTEQIEAIEDLVQSVDIAAFNKL